MKKSMAVLLLALTIISAFALADETTTTLEATTTTVEATTTTGEITTTTIEMTTTTIEDTTTTLEETTTTIEATTTTEPQATTTTVQQTTTTLEEEDEEDLDDAEIMHTNYGARVRMLQLLKRVTRNYIYGEHVIDQIEENDFDIDTSAPEDILSEMEDLKQNIEDSLEGDLGQDSVDDFIEFKAKAINLTRQFREYVSEELTIAQRQAIKDKVDKEDFSELSGINQQLRNAVRDHNRERVMFLLEKLGAEDEELLARVESGDITVAELQELVKQKIRKVAANVKKQFVERIKEDKLKQLAARNRALVKKIGLNEEQIERVRGVMNDNALTPAEKRARLNVMARNLISSKIQERLNERADAKGGKR